MQESHREEKHQGSPLDLFAVILGAAALTWFLFWLASEVAGKPIQQQLPPELHDVVQSVGGWLTATVAGGGSLAIWFLQRERWPVQEYLLWVTGGTISCVVLVVLLVTFLQYSQTHVSDALPDFTSENVAYQSGLNRMSAEDWRAADQWFAKITEKNPYYGQALSWRARAAYELGNYNAAAEFYKKVEKASGSQEAKEDARYGLARIYVATKAYDLAVEILGPLSTLPRFVKEPKVIYNLAAAYYYGGNFEQARTTLQSFPFASQPEAGEANRDIWGRANFLKAEIDVWWGRKYGQPINCKAVRQNVVLARELVPKVMVDMEPTREFLKACGL